MASLATVVAGSAATLFAARAGQGLGATMLSPAALSIITTAFQGNQRAKALAAWGAVGGAGPAIGVLIGGFLTEVGDWRLIFYVNLPVAVVLAVAAMRVIPRDLDKPRWHGLDMPGALLGTVSLGTLVYAITQAEHAGWGSTQTFGLTGAALAGLGMFAVWERRAEKPLLRVERLADRAIGGGLFLMIVAAGSIFGLFLLCSLYLQNVLGTGPLKTGLAFIPLALAAGVGAHAAGFGLGIAIVSVSIAILTGAREDESGMISGLNSTGPEIGGTIGIAVFSTIAAGVTGAPGGVHAASGISSPLAYASRTAEAWKDRISRLAGIPPEPSPPLSTCCTKRGGHEGPRTHLSQ